MSLKTGFQIENSPVLKQRKGVCVGDGDADPVTRETMKCNPGGPVWVIELWVQRFIRRQNTAQLFITLGDSTTLESYHSNQCFIFCCKDCSGWHHVVLWYELSKVQLFCRKTLRFFCQSPLCYPPPHWTATGHWTGRDIFFTQGYCWSEWDLNVKIQLFLNLHCSHQILYFHFQLCIMLAFFVYKL